MPTSPTRKLDLDSWVGEVTRIILGPDRLKPQGVMTSAGTANLMLVMIWRSVPRLSREAQGRRRKAVVAKLVDQGSWRRSG